LHLAVISDMLVTCWRVLNMAVCCVINWTSIDTHHRPHTHTITRKRTHTSIASAASRPHHTTSHHTAPHRTHTTYIPHMYTTPTSIHYGPSVHTKAYTTPSNDTAHHTHHTTHRTAYRTPHTRTTRTTHHTPHTTRHTPHTTHHMPHHIPHHTPH
jgi:hypothetical protein